MNCQQSTSISRKHLPENLLDEEHRAKVHSKGDFTRSAMHEGVGEAGKTDWQPAANDHHVEQELPTIHVPACRLIRRKQMWNG